MHHCKSEMVLHVVEIPILMQQRPAVIDTKCSDHHVDGFPYRYAVLPEVPVVPRNSNGCFSVQHRFDVERTEPPLDGCRTCLALLTLQDFHKNQIAYNDRDLIRCS